MRCFLSISIVLILSAAPVWAEKPCSSALLKRFGQARNPAAALSHSEVYNKLKSLSPQLDDQQVAAKIAAAKDSFQLYRSFVPAYCDLFKPAAEAVPALKNLKSQTGWIFGDVHPENFGEILSDEGKAIFTMNDMDDGARGPLVADLVRFLGAVNLYDREIDLTPLVKVYRKGLANEDVAKPKLLKALKMDAESAGQVPGKKLYDKGTKILVRSEDTAEVNAQIRNEIVQAIGKAFGDSAEVRDVLMLKRTEGGSGGLKRYEALVRMDKKSGTEKHHVVVEFKQMIDASIARFTEIPQPSVTERVRLGLKYAQGGSPSRFYSVQKIGNDEMLLRPRFAGNRGVTLSELDSGDAKELILYEAGLLGQLHRGSADSVTSYLRALSEVSDAVLTGESQKIADVFREYYAALISNP